MDERWTFEWPDEAGYYWFYGWTHPGISALKDPLPEMLLAKAYRAANGPIVVVAGSVFVDRDRVRGVWQPAELPEPPVDLLQGEL